MKKSKLHLQLFLMFIVVTAVILIFTNGNRYFGKTYYESNQFENETGEFIYELSQYVLNAPTEADFEKVLTVSEEEIQNYRTYYGTLAQQIQNIKEQYMEDLDGVTDSEVIEAIEQERDAKIADIKKNFEDDEYVKDKIIAIKKKAVTQKLTSIEREKKRVLNDYSHFAYEFVDKGTGEIFSNGDINERAVYKKTYNNVGSIYTGIYPINYSEYDSLGVTEGDYTLEQDLSNISGAITIPKAWFDSSSLGKDMQSFKVTKYVYYCIIAVGALSLLLLLTKFKVSLEQFNNQSQFRRLFERMPIDLRLIGAAILGFFGFLFNGALTNNIQSMFFYERYINLIEGIIIAIVSYVSFIAFVYVVAWIWQYFKENQAIEKIWPETFLSKLVNASVNMFENRSIGIQSLILLGVIFLGGFGFAVVTMSGDGEVFLFYALLFVVFFIPALFIFMRRMGYLNRIMKHTEDMANGRLTNDLKVKGKSPLAKHAANLNGLRDGVRNSLNEQAKSERMKTELITNVSHDLRTPLTSIITYTDLLKNPDITEDERAKYIAILDSKSNRLKTLIEDLFEVSKMASGNIEISKQRIDLAQLLQQAAGEHGEDFASSNLDLRVNIQEQPIFAYVDGQKWWRVIDNLIVNARKYSLEGTRVYVNLKLNEGNAELTVKNVAKYELHEDASELIERFKRADASRHTDGSGLGLAIAQSIVDLHGGQMEIAVDGDLFKVTVLVRADK
ncbi:histidine kinase [Lysinibacillus sp. 2017]|uniref:HAMP domain-containing sensor histidine kinase n=1 Tax=unclassified Lysinibacillus TaxID=2636778 RepID=UPI000D527D9B|nr:MULTISPECIES: HAMP domain-containing sensor histidine kinase [unclassified Lysinibacillus]AWE06138.1 histidine kinase [Lysinibacillus sp. 2017]TGN35207.1 histidine kinase [Lysinibacillus sp. S2017]